MSSFLNFELKFVRRQANSAAHTLARAANSWEGLWYRVLAARYGVERGRLRDGGRRASSWWREIVRSRDSGGGIEGAWFGECISKKVGDGSDTLCWSDPWVDGIPLCERFGRLFYLAETQSCSVAEMTSLGWGAGGEAWVWRRPLRGWEEEMLGECQSLLLNISLQVHSSDRWLWHRDPDNGYSARSAYQLLTSQDSVTLHVARQVTHKSKSGHSRHFIIGGSLLCIWMRSG
ncbi:hypothetical protein TSUD_398070 [Trifolium subterraneum]|uniref:Uncharacterized protein n=1 Tax=Trifolium subterraneum TaxID=3900 RepID=A0A2Z6NBK9_TRISU|nr:hypothetical protein TSUD_398070 [Trifolium subterraneum]